MKKSALIVGLIGVAVVAYLISRDKKKVQEEGGAGCVLGRDFCFCDELCG